MIKLVRAIKFMTKLEKLKHQEGFEAFGTVITLISTGFALFFTSHLLGCFYTILTAYEEGDNWLVSVGLQWNLFNGFADRARTDAAKAAVERSTAEQARTESAIRLQVRRASADLDAATQRIEVAKASVAQAEESLRITQNRYEAGLGNVTDLLRTETALLEARTRQLAAVRDQRMAAAMVELASGTLTADSPVLAEGTR